MRLLFFQSYSVRFVVHAGNKYQLPAIKWELTSQQFLLRSAAHRGSIFFCGRSHMGFSPLLNEIFEGTAKLELEYLHSHSVFRAV